MLMNQMLIRLQTVSVDLTKLTNVVTKMMF